MTRLIVIFFLLVHMCMSGQTLQQHACKIEFYLLKRVIPNTDSSKKLSGQFVATTKDLMDTAFIKDSEILSYSIKKHAITNTGRLNTIEERPRFKVANQVNKRINSLQIPLCCGRQFALVVNGKIIYAGYFWNAVSSFGSDWITAFSPGNYLEVVRKIPDYESAIDSNDPRRNSTLSGCLTLSNRLIK